ncbi:MAG: YdcF family protein [Cyclobacteriaceae bacterium]
MFFVISKLVSTLIMPISLISTLFIISFFFKKRRKLFLGLGVFLLLFFSNPFLANMVMRWWEVPAIRIDSISEPYAAGVVLCGVTDTRQQPNDRVHFLKGADRIVHAVQLYKEGKIRKILVSGGSGDLLHPEEDESQDMYQFARMCGVRKRDILLENKSRNTHQNAQLSKKILEEEKIQDKILLITSAFHMRRARGCFEKEGVAVDIFSTDLNSGEIEFSPIDSIVPNVGAISTWTILFKEWIGIAAYKVVGYI